MIEYITEFRRLSSRVNDTEEAKIFKFICGLNPATANEVAQCAPAKLEAAIESALLYEARKASVHAMWGQNLNPPPGIPEPVYNGPVPMELDNMQQNRWNRSNSYHYNRRQPTVRASTYTNCPLYIWNPAYSPQLKKQYLQENRCFYCGLQGHQATDTFCPRPRKENSRINNIKQLGEERVYEEEEKVADNRPVISHYCHAFSPTSIPVLSTQEGARLFQLSILVMQENKNTLAWGLKDDRATHNFISQQFVEKNNLQVRETNQKIQFILPDKNQKSAPIKNQKTCKVRLRIRDKRGQSL